MSEIINKVDAISLVEQFTEFKVGNKNYFARTQDLEKMPYNSCASIITPISFNQNVLVNGGYIDYDLSGTICHKIDSIVVQATIKNTDAVNALGLLPLQFLINRVEVFCNGSLKETIYSQNLYTSDILSTSEMNAQYALTNGYNASTYNVASNIAASGTKYLQTEIQCFLEKLYMPVLQNTQVRLRVYWNSGSSTITSTSPAAFTAIQMNNTNIYLRGREFTPEIKSRLDNRFRTDSHVSRCVLRRQQVLNVGAVSAGSYINQTLSAYTGSFYYLRVVVLPPGANQETQLGPSYQSLTSITLLDSGGRPWSFQDMPGQLILNSLMPQVYNTLATTVVNCYELGFASDPAYTFLTGRNTGDLRLDGRWQLKINPNFTNAGGADLYILSMQEAVLIQSPSSDIQVLEV